MSTYFGRDYKIQIYPDGPYRPGFEILPPFAVSFSVKHTRGKTGGDHSVKVYNLSRETLKKIRPGTYIAVYAGYSSGDAASALKLIGSGHIIKNGINTDRQNPDTATELKFKSGFKLLMSLSRGSWRAGTSLVQVFKDLTDAGALAIGETPATSAPSLAFSYSHLQQYTLPTSYTANDSLANVLAELGNIFSLEPVERDGLLTLAKDENLTGKLNPGDWPLFSTTGRTIFSSPNSDDKGLKLKTFLDGNLRPGQPVHVDHPDHAGTYSITDVIFSGDTHADDWDSQLTLKRLETA